MTVRNPHHYAIVVGINEYPAIGSLTKPIEDAKSFHKWLIDPALGGLNPDHCEVEIQADPYPGCQPAALQGLSGIDKRSRIHPKTERIKDSLIKWLDIGAKLYREKAVEWTKSRLYIFFAGHGMAENFRDCDLFAADAGQGYYSNRVPCEYLLNYLVQVRPSFHEVLVFADCCRSTKAEAGQPAFQLDKARWPPRPVRFASCYATLFNDKSYETTKEDGRGFFSMALLEGLKGAAAEQGVPITTENLRTYLLGRVKALTESVPYGPQIADLIAPEPITLLDQSPGPPLGSGSIPLGVEIKFLRFTGQARIHGPDDQPLPNIPLFDAAPDKVWKLPALPPAIYHVTAETGDPGLLKKEGFFSWKNVPSENGVSKPVEM